MMVLVGCLLSLDELVRNKDVHLCSLDSVLHQILAA